MFVGFDDVAVDETDSEDDKSGDHEGVTDRDAYVIDTERDDSVLCERPDCEDEGVVSSVRDGDVVNVPRDRDALTTVVHDSVCDPRLFDGELESVLD